MRPLLYRTLILLAVIGLIAAPVLLSVNADIRRADYTLAAGRPLEAAADLEHAAHLLFWRTDLMERAGRAAFTGGDLLESVRLLEQANHLSVDGWSDLGAAYYQLGQFKESARALQRGLDIHGANASLYRGLALARNAQGDFEGEAAAMQQYIALDDTEAAARYRLGLLLSVFDSDNALPELMASAKLDEAYDQAVQSMRSALNLASLESDEASRLVVIGRGLGLVREWALAREAFQRAVRADEKNAEAWAWLGEANQHLGQDGSGELRRAEALDPFSANVRALSGLYWKRMNDPQKALVQFQWAAAIEPKNPAFLAALGDAYAFAGDLPPALAAYQRATELAPADATYWRTLALFSGQYSFQVEQVGIPAAQQVLELRPDEATSFDLLGWTYLAANVTGLAEENLLAALRLNPDYAPAHLHLGMMYLQMNKLEAARTHLLRAQALDAEGAEGQAATQLLVLYFP
jgi:tetratricopeptide (TPR) repeat protein